MIGKLVTRKFGEEVCGQNSLNGQKIMKIFLSHMNIHQRMKSAEKNFNNQMDIMTLSVDTSQPLSLAISVITQWTHEQSSHGGRDGGYLWVQQHGLTYQGQLGEGHY